VPRSPDCSILTTWPREFAKYADSAERAEQKLFAAWLTQHALYFFQARSDKRSTIRVGHPDFTIFENGRTVFTGMKKARTQPSADQICCMDMLRDRGFTTVIAQSAVQAIELTKDFLGI
jgi:hypothetical protein